MHKGDVTRELTSIRIAARAEARGAVGWALAAWNQTAWSGISRVEVGFSGFEIDESCHAAGQEEGGQKGFDVHGCCLQMLWMRVEGLLKIACR